MIDTEELKYLKNFPVMERKKVLVLADLPFAEDVKRNIPYNSQSCKNFLTSLAKVGVKRDDCHLDYLFHFRPEKGDLSALFYMEGFPVSEYTTWPMSKKDAILSFAYRELERLRDTIHFIQPDLIICSGKWSLYFLTGATSQADTKKSQFGTLIKWRASHLKLNEFWNYEKSHVVVPTLPMDSYFKLPEYEEVIKRDFQRLGAINSKIGKPSFASVLKPAHNYRVAPSFNDVRQFLHEELIKLESGKIRYAIDVETKSGYQDCIGICRKLNNIYDSICIPFSTMYSPHYWEENEEVEIIYLLREFFLHPNCQHVGQNYWYDLQYEWRDYLVERLPADDTMILHHAMTAGIEKNLAFITSLYGEFYSFWKDEGKIAKGKTDSEHWTYNCRDTCYTYEVIEGLEYDLSLNPKSVQEAYKTQLNDTLPCLIKLMKRGVREDSKRREKLRVEFTDLRDKLREELNYIIGEEFNPNSPDQKKSLLYDLFMLPEQYDPQSGKVTTGGDALEILAQKYPITAPIINRISELGQINTLVSNFLSDRTDIDGRLRCNYNICGTDTFRLSSSANAFGTGRNLQNIPKTNITVTGRELPNIREMFIPDEGYSFFDIDLDSADLRIVAAEARAIKLIQMFEAGLKPYVEAMKEYYHDPGKSKHSKEYPQFKACIHALDYLGSPEGIAIRVGLLVHEVDRLAKWWFAMNPEIKKNFHEELRKQVRGRRWIENIFGYRRYFFNIKEPTLMQIAAAWKPQSTVGLIINKGLVNIERKEPEIQTLLQVHDSLAGQYPTDKPHLVGKIKEHCQIVLPYEHPIIIPVDVKTSPISWGHCG